MVNIETLEQQYFANGYDVPYELKKGGTIFIKPILVKDYPIYEYCKDILDIRKNEINDIQIIQMTYLDFILKCLILNEEKYMFKLIQIMKLCLGEELISFDEDNGKLCLLICNKDETIRQVITSKEFDDIRKIILNQNDCNYDDRYISPDVREAYEEYCQLKYKNINSPSLEKMKAFVMCKSGFNLEQINNMQYRMFNLVYHSGVDSEIYIGQKIIQGSYKYDVKVDITHPQFEKPSDPITEMFSDAESFERKVQQVNG